MSRHLEELNASVDHVYNSDSCYNIRLSRFTHGL